MWNRPKKQENFSARQVITERVLCVLIYFVVSRIVGFILLQKKYRQKVDRVKFTQVADTPSIKHAKKSQELQSDVRYCMIGCRPFDYFKSPNMNEPFLVLSWHTKRAQSC